MLLVDKPVGFSSFQIVRVLKKQYKKVGHAGTLDPFASGLLIILVGSETKKFSTLQVINKEYVGELILGISTNTYDISGEHIKKFNKSSVENYSLHKFNKVAERFLGVIEQRPPKFSAIQQNGKRLYQLVRRGIDVIPKNRKVLIESFTFIAVQYPILKFNVVVGKGVYIRSLANDFGDVIGCGASLMSLRRVRIGTYNVTQAKKLGDILAPDCSKNHYEEGTFLDNHRSRLG